MNTTSSTILSLYFRNSVVKYIHNFSLNLCTAEDFQQNFVTVLHGNGVLVVDLDKFVISCSCPLIWPKWEACFLMNAEKRHCRIHTPKYLLRTYTMILAVLYLSRSMVFIIILCKIEGYMSVYFISLSEVTEEHNCGCPELPD